MKYERNIRYCLKQIFGKQEKKEEKKGQKLKAKEQMFDPIAIHNKYGQTVNPKIG